MDPRPCPQFPHAGIGLVMEVEGLLSDLFQPFEIVDVGGAQQSLVEEGLRCPQHDIAEDIVLEVLMRLIADTYRTHAAIAGNLRDDPFADLSLQPDAVDGLHVPAVGIDHDIAQPAQVVLHGADLGQRIECADDEEGIAQPAEAIVPVPPRPG